jgi:hypothetical protein
MGYIKHNAIVVTGWDLERLNKAREKAMSLTLDCSPIVASTTNGYQSFLIAPDGSTEGWDRSTECEGHRAAWIEWVRTGEGRELYLDWAHISYGGNDADGAYLDDFNEKGANG